MGHAEAVWRADAAIAGRWKQVICCFHHWLVHLHLCAVRDHGICSTLLNRLLAPLNVLNFTFNAVLKGLGKKVQYTKVHECWECCRRPCLTLYLKNKTHQLHVENIFSNTSTKTPIMCWTLANGVPSGFVLPRTRFIVVNKDERTLISLSALLNHHSWLTGILSLCCDLWPLDLLAGVCLLSADLGNWMTADYKIIGIPQILLVLIQMLFIFSPS